MNEIILLKLGELVLKGLNRRSYEDKLLANIRRRLRKFGEYQVTSRQSTIYVEPLSEDCDLEGAYNVCSTVFGIVSMTRARACAKDRDAILACAKDYLAPQLSAARSFKVESKRADKTFPLSSIQLSQYVGGGLHEAFPHLTVDVHNPELTVLVEVRETAAYVHGPAQSGAGGLPIGMGGTAVSLLSGGIDSPVASYLMARRGMRLEMVHFYSPPYTSPQALEKTLALAKLLVPWCGRLVVHTVPFTEIQESIRQHCPEDYFTLIMRRFMMRCADRVADRVGARCLVTGECLGQVASQTVEAMASTEDAAARPIFRPVIAMDKEEIIRIARRIGTFETSIQPFEDCCTVFTPRHPRTHPAVEDVRHFEEALDVEGLVNRAMEASRYEIIRY